jgi:hypothetical protein
MGMLLAAEFLVAVGDTREGFTSADQWPLRRKISCQRRRM